MADQHSGKVQDSDSPPVNLSTDRSPMQRKAIRAGRLKSAGHDERTGELEIEFNDGAVRVFKGVPVEVWRRLLASPNPASYFDDRIADEYPSRPGSADPPKDARSRLDTLFDPSSTERP